MGNEFLDAALSYAARGWAVFPLVPQGKEPLLPKGCNNATTDTDTIRGWWLQNPRANIGIEPRRSRLVVLDIDQKNGIDGWQSWADLKTMFGAELENTVMVATPSGGGHVYYSLNGETIPNLPEGKLAPGIGVRADNYYVVAPPSIHPDTGTAYAFEVNSAPNECELAEIPTGLKQLIIAAHRATEAPADNGAGRVSENGGDIIAGERNNRLISLAGTLRRQGIEFESIYRALADINARQCKPPLDDDEVQRLAKSAIRYEPHPTPPADPPPPWMSTAPADDDGPIPIPPGGSQEQKATQAAQAKQATPPPTPPPGQRPLSSWSDMAAVIAPITWDWYPWIARGFLHILAGASGKGKSSLMLRIAQCYLELAPWLDGNAFTGQCGQVLWCECEGAQALNLSRARQWGMNTDNIVTPLDDPLEDLNLASQKHRTAMVKAAQNPAVGLILVDSLSGARAGQDENDSRGLATMKWLAQLARDTNKGLIASHHLRKRSMLDSGEVDLDRLRGSSAITQLARIVWALESVEGATGDALRLRQLKNNIAPIPAPLGVIISGNGVSSAPAPQKPEASSEVDTAKQFLETILKPGPTLYAFVTDEARKYGIAKRTLERAKSALWVQSTRIGTDWYWVLPGKHDPTTIHL